MIDDTVEAIRAGKPVVLAADTVYGLATTPHDPEAAARLYAVKHRPAGMPSALLALDLDTLFECVPELRGRSGRIARALLPGPYTLIFPNPARRFPWLAGDRPETIGVRVCSLPPTSRAVLEQVRAVLATSANVHGQPDPKRPEELDDSIRSAVAAIVDDGELPGVRSTIVDFSGPEPEIVREGAASGAEAIERALAALGDVGET
jgi:tRNA threonylcarbamoyl adenosine modification protein (Sua5/YciO/YrdC/YwlC family)